MYKDIICGIYCIENLTNHKKYIGQSKNINARWYHHKHELNNNIHDNDYLQHSWNKYGADSFSFYILEKCESENLDDREIYYINLYNTTSDQFGYNLKTGGQFGSSKLSEYSRKKLSESVKLAYDDSLKNKRKEDALKQWADPEIKNKITGVNNGMYGKHHSEETKKKISEINKGRISKQRNPLPVLCIELNRIFSCSAEAAKELLIQSNCILQVCRGQRHTAGGYHWEFVLENN